MQGFQQIHGLIRYNWFKNPPLLGRCEWCKPTDTELDHCHLHGWIRGGVCPYHNNRLQLIDAGVSPERWQPWQVAHWLRCPDCAATLERNVKELSVNMPGMTLSGALDLIHLALR
jgi:hypothetical protein